MLIRFTLAILAALSMSSHGGAVVLVTNGDFEKPGDSPEAPPPGWNFHVPIDTARFELTDKVAHGGTHSVCIETTSDLAALVISDPVPVVPGELLSLSGWYRTEDLSTSSGGRIALTAGFLDRNGKYFSWSRHRLPLPETDEWFQVETTAVVPARAAFAVFQAGFRAMKGKLYVDDAEMKTANDLAARVDLFLPDVPIGESTAPVVIINRKPEPDSLSVVLQVNPGGRKIHTKLSGPETTVTVPLNLEKRGKNIVRLRMEDESGPVETTFTAVVPPLLLTEPVVPTHALIEEKSPQSFTARCWVNETPAARKEIRAKCVLLNSEGKQVALWRSESLPENPVTWQMRLRRRETKPTTFTARLTLERKGQVIASAENLWRIIPRDSAVVTLNDDGYPVAEGKAFFPLGMYMGGNAVEMKEAGFNVNQTYGPFSTMPGENPNNHNQAILEFLDKSHNAGMEALMFVNHGLQYRLGREETLHRVRMFRNHPAVLCWYQEEAVARGIKPLSWLKELYDDLRREGKGHPVLIGDEVDESPKIKDRSRMFPVDYLDIITWWWYPVPPRQTANVEGYEGEPAGETFEYVPPTFLTQARTKKPIWVALQCYRKPDVADARFPTPGEYRCHAYIAICHGAKGLYYYTGLGERNGGILHHKEAGHWEDLKLLIKELNEMAPVFMSPNAKDQIKADNPMISCLTKQVGKKRVLMAVNRCNQALNVTFTGTNLGKNITVKYENRETAVAESGSNFTDRFEPYAVHVYEL